MHLLLFSILFGLSRAFDPQGNDNVAVYWGQNSYAQDDSQQRLAHYCEDASADIIMLSFLNKFNSTGGMPQMNFANACGGGGADDSFNGTNLYKCPDIGYDIKQCQNMGKKILLSLGGSAGDYGFSSDTEAVNFGDQLWDLFGGGMSESRPFGDTSVDGFDFDIEQGGTTGYGALANRLRENFGSDTSKRYYLSAAPQCVPNDRYLHQAMIDAEFDFLFVQFYNNYCGLEGYQVGQKLAGTDFNFNYWHKFATRVSKNQDTKVFVGLPAGETAAGSGYLNASTAIDVALQLKKQYPSFGGISLWDASQAWQNTVNGVNYAKVVHDGMKAEIGPDTTILPSNKLPNATTTASVSSVKVSSRNTNASLAVTSVTSNNVSALQTSLVNATILSSFSGYPNTTFTTRTSISATSSSSSARTRGPPKGLNALTVLDNLPITAQRYKTADNTAPTSSPPEQFRLEKLAKLSPLGQYLNI